MGFTTGFTGGVTLTLSLAYLTVLAHQRNRERQSALIRQQLLLVSGLTDPLPPVLPPTRADIVAAQRANFIESAKDRWNAEVEGAVKWLQDQDWEEVRGGVETAVGRIWAKAFGEARREIEAGEKKAQAVAGDVKDKAQAELEKAGSVASAKADGIAAAARSAFADAKARGSDVVAAAQIRGSVVLADAKARGSEVAADAKTRGSDVVADTKTLGSEAVIKAEEKAEEAKGSLFSILGKGFDKGKEALGIAKAKAVEAEQTVEAKIDEQLSPVERTLRQRYEQPQPLKSVEEALAERYVPEDKKDHTALRGL